MQSTTYALKHLFNNDVPVLRSLRNFGMDAANALIPFKKLLMRHALD
jgi:2-polyprenyl-6-methoxyphenol hydroxylase-like FAD-dependent oxidoreductase